VFLRPSFPSGTVPRCRCPLNCLNNKIPRLTPVAERAPAPAPPHGKRPLPQLRGPCSPGEVRPKFASVHGLVQDAIKQNPDVVFVRTRKMQGTASNAQSTGCSFTTPGPSREPHGGVLLVHELLVPRPSHRLAKKQEDMGGGIGGQDRGDGAADRSRTRGGRLRAPRRGHRRGRRGGQLV
jgi:hypothetical protein